MSNERKHGVSFEDAALAFDAPFTLVEEDRSAGGEVRWRALGLVADIGLVLVIHTSRYESENEIIRIISARRATPRERRHYAENYHNEFRR